MSGIGPLNSNSSSHWVKPKPKVKPDTTDIPPAIPLEAPQEKAPIQPKESGGIPEASSGSNTDGLGGHNRRQQDPQRTKQDGEPEEASSPTTDELLLNELNQNPNTIAARARVQKQIPGRFASPTQIYQHHQDQGQLEQVDPPNTDGEAKT